MTDTRYHTIVGGASVYIGEDLEAAIRAWDRATYALGHSQPGGISVATYAGNIQTRDGWILHVSDDGVTYLNPRLAEAE